MVTSQAFAMSNYDDPRVLLSYMDRSLSGERDILRLTTTVADASYLVFEIKARTPEGGTNADDYLLLEVSQDKSHQLLIPIDPKLDDTVIDYRETIDFDALRSAGDPPKNISMSRKSTTRPGRDKRSNGAFLPSPCSIISVPRGSSLLEKPLQRDSRAGYYRRLGMPPPVQASRHPIRVGWSR